MNQQPLDPKAVDFQPDAVEIAMRPLPLAARMGILFGVIVFFTALIASYVCKVDVIVEGSGKLVSVNQNIVMKPYDRSVIKSIDVKVGQVVKKGQLLISFDPDINKAEEARLCSELANIQAQYSRWQAEFSNKDFVLPANPNQARTNVNYIDGHVESPTFQELYTMPQPPDANIVNESGANRGSASTYAIATGYLHNAGAPQGH